MSTILQPPRPLGTVLANASLLSGTNTSRAAAGRNELFGPCPPSFSLSPRGSDNDLRLPALATLASLASQSRPMNETVGNSSTVAPSKIAKRKIEGDDCRIDGPNFIGNNNRANMSYATVAPGQSADLANGIPPVCANCTTSTTPLWRRDEDGNVLCNACGLFLKLHGRSRPISLKTNIIKSRNRAKAPTSQAQQAPGGPPPKKKKGPGATSATPQDSPDLPNATGNSLSRGLSELEAPSGNIAPQHMFDSFTIDNPYHAYAPRRSGSPSGDSLLNGVSGPTESSPSELLASNNHLKTRVSELEVINNLFRERVAELEGGESETKRALEDALRKIKDLETRVAELEGGAGHS